MRTHPDTYAVLAGVELIQGLGLSEMIERAHLGNRLAEAGHRILAFYLAEIDAGKLYRAAGFSSMADFALREFGIDRRRCSELILVGRKLLELSALDDALLEGRLAWSKVVLLVRVVTPENAESWVAHAEGRTVRDLADDVRRKRRGELPSDPSDGRGTPHTRFEVRASVDKNTYDVLEIVRGRLQEKLERPVTADEVVAEVVRLTGIDPTPPTFVEKRDENGEGTGEFVEDGRTDELDPKTSKTMRDEVIRLDKGRCQHCGRMHDLHVHHVIYRCNGGRTIIANLICVCKGCHGLIHDGYLVCQGTRDEGFRFYDRDGRCFDDAKGDTPPEHRIPLPKPRKSCDSDEPAEPHPDPNAPPEIASAEVPDVPKVIDHEWWRRHAALIRFHKGGVIELVPGLPHSDEEVEEVEEVEDAPEKKRTPKPVEEAFEDLVVEDRLLDLFATAASSARTNGKVFPHTLLAGPPGTGKTSLANGIADLIGTEVRPLIGQNLQDIHHVIRTLATLGPGNVLFVDEVHGATKPVMDLLLGALQEGEVTLSVRLGAFAKEVKLKLPPFTMVAATTEEQELTRPFKDRFGIRESLGRYELGELVDVVLAIARRSGIEIENEAAWDLAEAARGTPRVAGKLLERAHDVATCATSTRIDPEHVARALRQVGYDERGLDPNERRYLEVLEEARGLRPVSLARIAAHLGLAERTIVREVEPRLLERGLIVITSGGRLPAWVHRLLERAKD